MNALKKRERKLKKDSFIRTIKNLKFIINNLDMQTCLITHEKHKNEIILVKKQVTILIRKITNKKIYTSNHMQFLIEIWRDLNSSIFLAEYAHYKIANSTLRNVLEHFLRFLYFDQHPEELDNFIFGNDIEKWHSLGSNTLKNVNFQNEDLKKAFKEVSRVLSKFTHSFENKISTNLVETPHWDPSLFDEWKSYFEITINLISKLLDDFEDRS